MNKWYKLDNAAKIFPPVSNKRRTNIFRLSFDMVEEVDPLILRKALSEVIVRFPMFKVKLKKGIFWYYLEPNKADVPLHIESPFICKIIENYDDNNGYLFRVSFFHKRISLETFHSLTDGAGALEFLKSIVYRYLELKEITITNNLDVLTKDVEISNEENQDDFVNHHNPKLADSKVDNDVRALQFNGQLYDENWLGLIVGTTTVDQIKVLAKKYDCTITELFSAIIFYSAFKSRHLLETKDKPFTIFVPVNLRRFFDSKTLRNFSLYIKTSLKLNESIDFEEIVKIVKRDFKDGIKKEKLQAKIANNVKLERNPLLRIVPIFIKEPVLKLGYYLVGDSVNTLSFSNIGQVKLPDAMAPYIDKVVFANGASYSSPLNLGVISYNNKITIAFCSKMIDRSFQKEFFRFLTEQNVDISIENNELEV